MQALRQWMTEHEKSQAWVAEQCGVKQPTVWAWLSGDGHPTVDNLKKLSALTSLSIDHLVGNTVDAA